MKTVRRSKLRLDVRLTPQQNAQKYFKLYNKAKTAEEVLTQQIEQGTAQSWIIWKACSLLSAKPKTSAILHSCARS